MFAKLITEEGKNLPEIPWNVYPRPLLKRDSFLCLNGEWGFSVWNKQKTIYQGKIIVPFSPESILSGVNTVFSEQSTLKYSKNFTIPGDFNKGKVFLHFGAVDQVAKVFVNGVFTVKHVGGYTPFSIDITNLLQEKNTIEVEVLDTLSDHVLPYGKQKAKRGGMWYTPVSGIWQTVWLESVPTSFIEAVDVSIELDQATFTVKGVDNASITVYPPNGDAIKILTVKGVASLKVPSPVFWSPENPALYHFTAKSGEDEIASYFALRTLEIKKINDINRLCLNGKPVFFNGLLDQGYWSDGLFLPAFPDMLTKEILKVKALGFNTLRKHIKIEPEIFYAECDRLGVIVWQDMINNGDYSFIKDTVLPTIGFIKKKDKNKHKNPKTRQAFLEGMRQTVNLLKYHPCICYWTIFNEGWGQFESQKCYELLKSLDDTRFIDTTSGWFKCGESDVDSRHIYFRKIKLNPPFDKPLVISEFGGFALSVENHVFNTKKTYGYGKCATTQDFVKNVRELYLNEIVPAVKQGLCGAIYTQVSDVEDEINGIFTYDRKVDKLTPKDFYDIKLKLDSEIE